MQARVFPYNVTRSGTYSRYRFPLTCSKCGYEKEFEAPKIFPDSVEVKGSGGLSPTPWEASYPNSDHYCNPPSPRKKDP